MKIAQVAPVWERVPPVKYGGIELVVYLLVEELVTQGHEVTLYATADSITSAKLKSVYDRPQRELMGTILPDVYHVAMAYRDADEFDIIHNHCAYTGTALAAFIKTPVLTTLHGVFSDLNKSFFKDFKDVCYFNSISNEQRKGLPELNYAGTVYNAIDVASFPFSEKKKDYFVLVGRVSPLKGTHLAAEVAKKAGIKLYLAGKVDKGSDTIYFNEKVKPHIDDKQVIFLGEISEEEKRKLYRDAKGFIFPLQWSEPFGLVMIEAMACGTPVIAFPYGAVPEVVVDKRTGFLVKDIDEMVGAIEKVDEIDPQECRRHVEEKFGVSRMASDYVSLYEKILREKRV